MHIEIIRDDRLIVRVSGEVDLSNVHNLRVCLDDAIKESPNGFILDMSDLQYIDSAGIAAIMAAYQHMHVSGGILALVVMNMNVRQLMALVHPEMLPGLLMCDDLRSAQHALDVGYA